jgi:hypothetical protein
MISLTRLLRFFNKPAAPVPTTEVPTAERSWFYARIVGRDGGSIGESLWQFQEVLPEAEGGWSTTDRVGVAKCANGAPIDDPPYVTIVRRDSDGWAFCARVGV